MVHIISLLATVCDIRTAQTKIPCSRLELRFWRVAVGSSGAPLTRSIVAVNALNAEISLVSWAVQEIIVIWMDYKINLRHIRQSAFNLSSYGYICIDYVLRNLK